MKTLKVTKPDFTGQDIYAALDVGRKSWKVCILTEACEHKTFTQPPDVDILVNYLHREFPGARYHCVYEAGYCGFWIYEQLTQRQVDCIVVNPADVPTKDRERAFKSDGVDTRKLGRGLRSAILMPSTFPRGQLKRIGRWFGHALHSSRSRPGVRTRSRHC